MTKNNRALFVAGAVLSLVVAFSLVGCGNGASETDLPQSSVTAALATNTEGAGYVHAVANSKFHMGATIGQKSEFGFSKLVGAEGVFATVARSGWLIAIPNADASSRKVAPLTTSGDAHNKAVLDYFVAAGLPSSQVANVAAHASAHQGGAVGDPASDVPVFDGFTSVISRQIDGIPVVESSAWASFNANNEVVEEAVYWPTVSDDVVQEAKAFRDFVADPSTGPAFVSGLPTGVTPGKIAIHHGAGNPWAQDESAVSYDVFWTTPAGSGRVRHFDRQGAEFKLKYETPAPRVQTRTAPPKNQRTP